MRLGISLKACLKQPLALLGCLLFGLVSLGSTAHAAPDYLHYIWRTEEGILDPVVRQIVQTHDGYLWLATEESLMRFDGAHFLEVDHKSTSERTDRWFTALIETRDGALWSSSPNGGLRYYKNGESKLFQIKDGLPSNYVMSLCEDKNGVLWIGMDVGLASFSDGHFKTFTNDVPGLVQSSVRALLQDHEGTLWIGTAKGVSRKTGQTFASYTNHFTVNPSIMSLYEDRENRVWIGTAKGLTVYEKGTTTHYTEDDGLAHGTVRAVIEDKGGNIWVGSQGGVQHLVGGKLVSPNIHSTSDFDDSISWVYTLAEDAEGDIWVGTNLGLNRLKPQRFQILSKENGLGHNVATLVYQDHAGVQWVGTYGGGLTRIDPTGKRILLTVADGLPNNFITALCEDTEGALWIGTDGAGLVRYQGGKFTQYLQAQDVRMNTIRAIYQDRKGDLWVGSNMSIGRFKNGTFTNEPIVISYVRTIMEDHAGNLWVASRTGLMRLSDGPVTTFMKRDGLAGTQVSSLYADADGALWIGTDAGGLTRYKDGKFNSLGAAQGFFKERVLHMIDDDYGKLWMATRNGIFSVSKKELNDLADGEISEVTLLSFGKKDGLKRAQCNGIAQPSGWKMADGTLWFPTMHGVVSFNPHEVISNGHAPPVAIENLTFDGKPVEVQQGIRIPPGHGNLQIDYTALSFQEPDRVKFRHKLEGFDSQWQEGTTRRSALYNHLGPGQYEFHVIACNNDGVWNETGAMLAFAIEPHFYQMYTFYGACLAVVGLSIFALFRLRVEHLRRREKQLAAEVEERTRALQLEIVERKQAEEALRKSQEMLLRQERLAVVGQLAAGIAHEFNNILTVVQGHTCLLLTNDKIAAEDKLPLERISFAADRAANLTKQLLTFSRKQMMQVRPLDLNEVINSMTTMLKRVIGEHIHLSFKFCPDLPLVSADAGMMEQVVINLAVNARDAMPAKGGQLTISIAQKEVINPDKQKHPEARDGTFACLMVADTGSGIPPENLKKIFEPFFTTKDVGKGTGLGLATVYGIAKQHHGWVDVESEVNRGTTFTIYLPFAGRAPVAPVPPASLMHIPPVS